MEFSKLIAFLNNKAWNHPFLCIGCLTDLNILSSSLLGYNESASYIQEKKQKNCSDHHNSESFYFP